MQKLKWTFDTAKFTRGRFQEPITEKQLDYIVSLANHSKRKHLMRDILDAIPGWKDKYDYDLQKLTKGHATYIIMALKGDINPTIVDDDRDREKQMILDEARRIMLGNKPNNLTGRNVPLPIDEDDE